MFNYNTTLEGFLSCLGLSIFAWGDALDPSLARLVEMLYQLNEVQSLRVRQLDKLQKKDEKASVVRKHMATLMSLNLIERYNNVPEFNKDLRYRLTERGIRFIAENNYLLSATTIALSRVESGHLEDGVLQECLKEYKMMLKGENGDGYMEPRYVDEDWREVRDNIAHLVSYKPKNDQGAPSKVEEEEEKEEESLEQKTIAQLQKDAAAIRNRLELSKETLECCKAGTERCLQAYVAANEAIEAKRKEYAKKRPERTVARKKTTVTEEQGIN